MDKEKVGQLIKQLREEHKLSQTQLAEKVYVTRQAVSQWETGRSLPDISTLHLLSDTFDIGLDTLCVGKKEATEEEKKSVFINALIEKEKTIKRMMKIFIITFILLFGSFLTYYFINSYKSIKVYTLTNVQSDFYTEGFLVLSKKNSYLKLDVYKASIDNMQLYVLENNEKKVIATSNDTSIYFEQLYGYDEYFNYNNVEHNIQNLYLYIKLKSGKEVELKLDHFKKYENNELLFEKDKEVGNGNNENNDTVPSKIRKEFKYEDGTYTLEIKKNNINISLYFIENTNAFGIIEKNGKSEKCWEYNIIDKNLSFTEFDSNSNVLNQFDTDSLTNNAKDIQEIVDYFIKNYQKVYLEE